MSEPHGGEPQGGESSAAATSPLLQRFEQFRDEIDAYVRSLARGKRSPQNDRRERLIKTSRDATSLSKKAIFHLHRFDLRDSWRSPSSGKNVRMLSDAHAKLDEIYTLLCECSKREELMSVPPGSAVPSANMLRFEGFIGGALEELIEAATFLHFLEHHALMPLADVQEKLSAPDGTVVRTGATRRRSPRQLLYVSPRRYLLGVSDLSGELMRFAINAVASPEASEVVHDVLQLQRSIYYSGCATRPAQLTRSARAACAVQRRDPQETAGHILVRVQGGKWCVSWHAAGRGSPAVAYTMQVRSSEFGTDPGMMQDLVRRALASEPADTGDTYA